MKEDIRIGEVDEAHLDTIEKILKDIPIDKSESSGWNCQSWSLEGFERLQQANFIDDSLTSKGLYEWLMEPDNMPTSKAVALDEEEATAA